LAERELYEISSVGKETISFTDGTLWVRQR
jgi:hypothetical protein